MKSHVEMSPTHPEAPASQYPVIHYSWIGSPTASGKKGHDTDGVMAMANNNDSNKIVFWCLEKHEAHYKEKFSKLTNVTVRSVESCFTDEKFESDLRDKLKISYDALLKNTKRPLTVRDNVAFKNVFTLFVLSTQGGYTLDTNVEPMRWKKVRLNAVNEFTTACLLVPDQENQTECWMMASPEDAANKSKEKAAYSGYVNEVIKIIDDFSNNKKNYKEYSNELGRQMIEFIDKQEPGRLFGVVGDAVAFFGDLELQKQYANTHKSYVADYYSSVIDKIKAIIAHANQKDEAMQEINKHLLSTDITKQEAVEKVHEIVRKSLQLDSSHALIGEINEVINKIPSSMTQILFDSEAKESDISTFNHFAKAFMLCKTKDEQEKLLENPNLRKLIKAGIDHDFPLIAYLMITSALPEEKHKMIMNIMIDHILETENPEYSLTVSDHFDALKDELTNFIVTNMVSATLAKRVSQSTNIAGLKDTLLQFYLEKKENANNILSKRMKDLCVEAIGVVDAFEKKLSAIKKLESITNSEPQSDQAISFDDIHLILVYGFQTDEERLAHYRQNKDAYDDVILKNAYSQKFKLLPANIREEYMLHNIKKIYESSPDENARRTLIQDIIKSENKPLTQALIDHGAVFYFGETKVDRSTVWLYGEMGQFVFDAFNRKYKANPTFENLLNLLLLPSCSETNLYYANQAEFDNVIPKDIKTLAVLPIVLAEHFFCHHCDKIVKTPDDVVAAMNAIYAGYPLHRRNEDLLIEAFIKGVAAGMDANSLYFEANQITGVPLLHMAIVRFQNSHLFKVLLEHGADLERKYQGVTLRSLALQSGSNRIVRAVKEFDAKPRPESSVGVTVTARKASGALFNAHDKWLDQMAQDFNKHIMNELKTNATPDAAKLVFHDWLKHHEAARYIKNYAEVEKLIKRLESAPYDYRPNIFNIKEEEFNRICNKRNERDMKL